MSSLAKRTCAFIVMLAALVGFWAGSGITLASLTESQFELTSFILAGFAPCIMVGACDLFAPRFMKHFILASLIAVAIICRIWFEPLAEQYTAIWQAMVTNTILFEDITVPVCIAAFVVGILIAVVTLHYRKGWWLIWLWLPLLAADILVTGPIPRFAGPLRQFGGGPGGFDAGVAALCLFLAFQLVSVAYGRAFNDEKPFRLGSLILCTVIALAAIGVALPAVESNPPAAIQVVRDVNNDVIQTYERTRDFAIMAGKKIQETIFDLAESARELWDSTQKEFSETIKNLSEQAGWNNITKDPGAGKTTTYSEEKSGSTKTDTKKEQTLEDRIAENTDRDPVQGQTSVDENKETDESSQEQDMLLGQADEDSAMSGDSLELPQNEQAISGILDSIDTSGEVTRSDLENIPNNSLSTWVETNIQPDGTLYLPIFRGATYSGGVWSSAADVDATYGDGSTASGLGYRAAAALQDELGLTPLDMRFNSTLNFDRELLAPYASKNVSGNSGQHSGLIQSIMFAQEALLFEGFYLPSLGDLLGLGFDPSSIAACNLLTQADVACADDMLNYAALTQGAYLNVPSNEIPRLTELVVQNPQDNLSAVTAFILETLSSHATYTTTPGTYPADANVAEYLLFESHAGYCQHFACAGVFMYRLYGYPARYVTGFIIPRNAFEHTNSSDAYSWVSDESATRLHAWVEVFTPSLGWVPVEVTPGTGRSEVTSGNNASGEQATNSAKESEQAASSQKEPAETTNSEEESKESASSTKEPAEVASSEEESEQAASSTKEPEEAASSEEEPKETVSSKEESEEAVNSEEEPTDSLNKPEEDSPSAPLDARTVAIIGISALVLAAILAIVITVLLRRKRILKQRESQDTAHLLIDLLAALNYADIMNGWQGTEGDFAENLAKAVPDITQKDASYLVAQADAAAFGSHIQPTNARCIDIYTTAALYAYNLLKGTKRVSFKYLRGFI
ncbi:MAG: transglutaminase domain-containing protein [Coriobacteriales bacterium]|nr:transglutaminase domain-containing protein [Coriobacteriales bacterium]